jgi:hypothetical protein
MDILDAEEGFLPQFQLDSNVQLLKSRIQMTLERVWVAKVYCMHLGGKLGDILQVVAQEFAESAEFGFSLIFGAKLKGLVRRALIHDLEPRVILKDVQHRSVRLP